MTFDVPRTSFPSLPEIKTPAEYAFQSLVKQIRNFEQATGDDEVVAAMLASFGQSVIIHIHLLRLGGQMICMEGVTGDGDPATLVQHFTQASILLLKARKAPTEAKRPIGFVG
jgi:hypothetical protein